MPTRPGLLDCIEGYYAAAPLPDARIEAAGSLDVPIGDSAWPYPARPRPGAGPVTSADVSPDPGVGVAWIEERIKHVSTPHGKRSSINQVEVVLRPIVAF